MEKLTKKEKREQGRAERAEYQQQLDKQQTQKRLMVWGGVIAAVVISVFGLIKLAGSSTTPSSQDTGLTVSPISSSDITTGPKNAKAKLIEYADFQCPGCAAMAPTLRQLLSDEQGKVVLAYRFFPLTQIHKNAMTAARAGYAAYLQGKFWEMNEMLFANQNSWAELDDPTATFQGYAKKLDLNMDKFNKDMTTDSTQKFIDDENNAGLASGVGHTPTLFLNGKEIDQQIQNYNDLKRLVENALR